MKQLCVGTTLCLFCFIMVYVFILQAHRHITDLFEGLRDGHNLLSLLEVLSQDSLVSLVTKNTSRDRFAHSFRTYIPTYFIPSKPTMDIPHGFIAVLQSFPTQKSFAHVSQVQSKAYIPPCFFFALCRLFNPNGRYKKRKQFYRYSTLCIYQNVIYL